MNLELIACIVINVIIVAIAQTKYGHPAPMNLSSELETFAHFHCAAEMSAVGARKEQALAKQCAYVEYVIHTMRP